jgi:signal transduction histidine kinase
MHVDALPEGGKKPDLERTVFRLGQMISQMLDAERLTLAGRRHEEVDLVELGRAAVAEVAPLAVASGYELSFAAAAERIVVPGDPHSISRAMTNLLGNAVAHGGGSGRIDLKVAADGAIDVSDQGEGVPPEAWDRIFEPFHRERWDRDGCGLGLHLVQEIMHAHGGKARVVSSGPGAVFRLQFPSAVADPVA